jgi:hypothetical protein
MNRRFQRRVSGNWTLTSPISTGSERVWRDDEFEIAEFPRGETADSSFTGGLKAPIMLRREVEVIDDIRRIKREAREPFFSSVGDADWEFSSALEREDNERRLAGRETGVTWRLDPADDMDMVRSSTVGAGDSTVWLLEISSFVSCCSTVSGLA